MQGWYHQIVRGDRRGALATGVRGFLHAISVGYGWVVRYRNWRFDTGRAKVHRLPVPVISVGNLTLGGTGKTPMVGWLAKWFFDRHLRVGVISRGYKAPRSGVSDEALELRRQLPELIHVEDPDRVRAGWKAIEQFGCQILVADDAFQHRRLARDLDIVLIDAKEPFGFGYLFPRGLLREPIGGLRRADVIVLSRVDMVSGSRRSQLRDQILAVAPQTDWVEAVHEPIELVNAKGETAPVHALAGQPVLAFCGIGQPEAFRYTLEHCSYHLSDFQALPDHYPYRPRQLAQLADWASQWPVAAVLCTLKDLTKIPQDRMADRPLWALRIGIRLVEGESLLENRLTQLMNKALEIEQTRA
ncbi:MAG: tetraacyldisaccharide 4'-kinase [Thermoguttaceae bacterium]|nr:tetraacyldisaccharide 4'-kinase [Thermoguttaceae bacterium]MDW8038346.1 tetraacyldisaccharide 4'-kinase [Thermoguttaceae bacterium]